MTDVVSDNTETPKKSLCLMLDEDIVNGLERLRSVVGFPIEQMISACLTPVVTTFLPAADLHEQGKLTADFLPEITRALDLYTAKADVARSRLDKKMRNSNQMRKLNGALENEGKSQTSSKKFKVP